jgi:hypothetical protein
MMPGIRNRFKISGANKIIKSVRDKIKTGFVTGRY